MSEKRPWNTVRLRFSEKLQELLDEKPVERPQNKGIFRGTRFSFMFIVTSTDFFR